MTQRGFLSFLSGLLISVLLFHAQVSFAFQMGHGSGNLSVRVTDMDDRPIGMQALVQLVASGSASVSKEGYCTNEGLVSFTSVAGGTYHLLVSGDGLERTDSGSFEVDERKGSQSIFVRVKKIEDTKSSGGGGPAVNLRDINVPEAASKEFDQASEAMGQQDWSKAVTHLNRAVAIYPKYVEAYSNLGAAYQHLGDAAQERQALQKAIDLDGHFAPALMNLGMLSIVEKKYPEAEDLLGRGSVADPTNPQILMLLAQAQLLTGHFDQVIASKVKLHAIPHHEKYAKVHYIAARAFEHENRASDAATELQTLLTEQPDGPLADAVRKELTNLHALNANSPTVHQ
jgi:tetratricopeptide (TPR) repeat protein